jgi:hypothetical protein
MMVFAFMALRMRRHDIPAVAAIHIHQQRLVVYQAVFKIYRPLEHLSVLLKQKSALLSADKDTAVSPVA